MDIIELLRRFGRQVFDWSPLMRCTATMIVDASMELIFLLWKVLILTPTMEHAIHQSVLAQHYPIAGMMILTSCIIAAICFHYQHLALLHRMMPMICALYISLTLCYHSYLVGTVAPITGVLLVGTGMIGLLLFGRKVIYPTLIIAIAILSGLTYAAMIGHIPYAPLFVYTSSPFPLQPHWWLFNTTLLYVMVLISVIVLFDVIITAWWKKSQEVLLLSQTDSLTKLYNRRSLTNYLQKLAKQPQPTCLILLDLDHFKKINDHFGHLTGDKILEDTALQLTHHVRQGDWVGRYGGEEFIIVLANTQLKQASEIAERCRFAISQLNIEHQSKSWQVTGSFGVLQVDGPFDMSTALSQVDALLYQAKHQGRNRVVADTAISAHLSTES